LAATFFSQEQTVVRSSRYWPNRPRRNGRKPRSQYGQHGVHSPEDLIKNLKRPRRVMIMVKAGRPVDLVIESLLPYLEEGDIVIDGGNSEFPDSVRRTDELKAFSTSEQVFPVVKRAL